MLLYAYNTHTHAKTNKGGGFTDSGKDICRNNGANLTAEQRSRGMNKEEYCDNRRRGVIYSDKCRHIQRKCVYTEAYTC